MFKFLALLCCIVCSYGIQHPLVADEDAYETNQARDLLRNILGSNGEGYELEADQLGFSWSNCGSATDTIQVKSLTLSPDPIVIPGSVNVSLDATITADIEAPTELKLVVKKKEFGVFIEIPCIDNLGSCTYKNPCELLSKFPCPEVFKEHGFNCKCPIKKNVYKLPPSSVKLPSIKLPSFADGEIKIQATLMQGSKRLGCYEVDTSLKVKSSVKV